MVNASTALGLWQNVMNLGQEILEGKSGIKDEYDPLYSRWTQNKQNTNADLWETF